MVKEDSEEYLSAEKIEGFIEKNNLSNAHAFPDGELLFEMGGSNAYAVEEITRSSYNAIDCALFIADKIRIYEGLIVKCDDYLRSRGIGELKLNRSNSETGGPYMVEAGRLRGKRSLEGLAHIIEESRILDKFYDSHRSPADIWQINIKE